MLGRGGWHDEYRANQCPTTSTQCYPSSRSRGVARRFVVKLIEWWLEKGRKKKDEGTNILGDIQLLNHYKSFHMEMIEDRCAEALECYVCNSYSDSRCADKEPNKALIQKCDMLSSGGTKYTMCRKTVQSIEFGVNGCMLI
ncbi:hypothetical protein PV327_007916 [Microctonus hyperodae]|uniref:Uncharacterized protein n=1 Tax=Microctonus hyperodae TaxID=165561 RepID=A0AA39KYZ7_MICHY|nr:hypothetical protein PV327_007916 [Microctonus hyperodae]